MLLPVAADGVGPRDGLAGRRPAPGPMAGIGPWYDAGTGPPSYRRYMDSLLRRPLSAPPAVVDGLVTALIAAVAGSGELAFLPGFPRWAAAVIAAAGILPAAWRRRWPRAVLAVTAAGWAGV